MKKYEMVAHVANPDGSIFVDKLSARIDEYQLKGLEVEVQYQHQIGSFSALVLGFKREEVSNDKQIL